MSSSVTSTVPDSPNPLLSGVTSPLLSVLSHDITKPIVHSLLRKCQAQSTLRSFLRRNTRKRNPKNFNQDHQHSCSTQTRTNIDETPRSHTVPMASTHFLFQALNSPSLEIRQTAMQILIDSVENNPPQIRQLCRILWDMCRDDMESFPKGGGCEGIVQIYGLLVHFMFSSFTSNSQQPKDTQDLFYTFMVHYDMLEWLTKYALDLVQMMIVQDGTNMTTMSEEEEIKNRMYLIMNLLFRCTCVATEPAHLERHDRALHYLWKRSSSNMDASTTSWKSLGSPLSRLLFLYHTLNVKKNTHVLVQDRVMIPDTRLHRIHTMLAKMVAVNAQVMLIPIKETDESSGDKNTSNPKTGGQKNPSSNSTMNVNNQSDTMDQDYLQEISRRWSRSSQNKDSTANRSFSSAAGVMNRTMSFLDHAIESISHRGDAITGIQSMDGGDNDDEDNEGDDDDDDDDNDDNSEDEADDHDEDESQDTEQDDIMNNDKDEEDDEDDDDDEVMHDDDDDDILMNDDDEEVDSDREHDDNQNILDRILVEVASAPYREDMVILDSFNRGADSGEISLIDLMRSNGKQNSSESSAALSKVLDQKTVVYRTEVCIRICMEILEAQYPLHGNNHHIRMLTPAAEESLIRSICDFVKPPKAPLKLKVFMRRAPTQEEFFRGSLSRNPILISSLTVDGAEDDATVNDLRQHIANDLQMSDSAELLELLVAGKILDMNLKVRVVAQTLWREHLIENPGASRAESGFRAFISGASFNVGGVSLSRSKFDDNTPMSAFPPMVVTYRLAGVDGEATEDKISEENLVDPDALPDTKYLSSSEHEKRMEKEYGLTRLVCKGRGIGILLHSLDSSVGETMKRIRRDEVERKIKLSHYKVDIPNSTRSHFLKNPPSSTLILLRHLCMITENRKKLVKAQAPITFLRLLLVVLNAVNDSPSNSKKLRSMSFSDNQDNNSQRSTVADGSNPTADALQELIEILSSDISDEIPKKSHREQTITSNEDEDDSVEEESESSLLLLLSSLRKTSLSPPLRKVIAKLLPFLTYGQLSKSKALASQFVRNIPLSRLRCSSSIIENDDNDEMLMETFIDSACDLPRTAVCDALRSELVRQGFVSSMRAFILENIPSFPPPWTPALLSKSVTLTDSEKNNLRQVWKQYYERSGTQIVFRILIGLVGDHDETKLFLAGFEDLKSESEADNVSFITACHWIETTSDKEDILTNGLGILAEELLDTLLKGNTQVEAKISSLRKITRERKKEIAFESRTKALSGMKSLPSIIVPFSFEAQEKVNSASESESKSKSRRRKRDSSSVYFSKKMKQSIVKPEWMLEMEELEDEKGLVCAICQEGRIYKPTEMLGLYTYMKKISLSYHKGGGKGYIDGTLMFLSIPSRLPKSLQDTDLEEDWYNPSLEIASSLKSTPEASQIINLSLISVPGSRSCDYITSVTAGNSVHCSCHERARVADRNHPKAPKSEWEGASLRNSRVTCNAILPLISKKNLQIPVVSLERSLSNHRGSMFNLLGYPSKCPMWNMLFDLHFLLLRIAYGEPLGNDCGGGSLTSNSALIFYDLFVADTLARNSEHDHSIYVQQARELSTCFLAASSILRSGGLGESTMSKRLRKGFIESTCMSCISCILFQSAPSHMDASANLKMRWERYKNHFLTGLLQCAGRRFALGIDGSGCVQPNSKGRGRATSFSEWDYDGGEIHPPGRRKHHLRKGTTNLEIYSKALRPMVTFFAIIDQLSKVFSLDMDDQDVESGSHKLVSTIESCYNTEDIHDLLSKANISLDHTTIIEEIDIGINSV